MNTCQTCNHLLKDERIHRDYQHLCECASTPFTFVSDLDTPHDCKGWEDNGGMEEVIGTDGTRWMHETMAIDATSEVEI